jgi:predicted Ser/Thr protein kinase
MNVTGPFVLKPNVLLVPCAELSDEVRARITFDEGDYTLSHRYGRAPVQVIDGETAALLDLFREPRTIVDAVIENSRALDRDPRVWFDELLPHFETLVRNRVLVPAGTEEDHELRAQFDSGATIAGWEAVRCVSLVEDTEIYQVRNDSGPAALKIARLTTASMRALFENETAILRRLDGSGIAPRLLESDTHEERPYAIVEWIEGVDAGVAAARRRHDRAALLELCASIADAYAALHAREVVHADVHARNVIVGDGVTLLDFGYSHQAGEPQRVGRAGMAYFFEPELLSAWRQGTSVAPSPAGEQYSLAALLYFLIAGHHYLDFRYDRDEMRLQIENEPALPFARHGVPPWPEVEQILFRALEKDPSRRYGSVAELAALLAQTRDATLRESLTTPLTSEAHALLETTLQTLARGGAMFASGYRIAPTASINFGCAGAAVGLLRIAETRGDARLLALADVWRSRAVALIGTEGAYTNEERGPRKLGDVTPYHTESGVHAAAAMVAAAMGDSASQRRAVAAFLRASRRPCDNLDVTLGRSGSLLAAAMLLPISEDVAESAAALRAFGAETMSAIWHELDRRPALPDSPKDTYLGIAHGWSGFLYAALRWCVASGDALPSRIAERLHELSTLKTPSGRGAFWRAVIDRPSDGTTPSWCNGSAGLVFLFTLAHRVFGDGQWLQLAELCAWNTWDERRVSTHLCCGTSGRAYALLNLYKHTGATEWLSRARELANHAAAFADSTDRPYTLWRGQLGVAVLIADLASPENARMPFFE